MSGRGRVILGHRVKHRTTYNRKKKKAQKRIAHPWVSFSCKQSSITAHSIDGCWVQGSACRSPACPDCAGMLLRESLSVLQYTPVPDGRVAYGVTLTPDEPITDWDGLDVFMKRVRSFFKAAVADGWMEGGGYAFECEERLDDTWSDIPCLYNLAGHSPRVQRRFREKLEAGKVHPDAVEMYQKCADGQCLLCDGTGLLRSGHPHVHAVVFGEPIWFGRESLKDASVSALSELLDPENPPTIERAKALRKTLRGITYARAHGWKTFDKAGGGGLWALLEQSRLGHSDFQLLNTTGEYASYVSKAAKLYVQKGGVKVKLSDGQRARAAAFQAGWMDWRRRSSPFGKLYGLKAVTRDPLISFSSSTTESGQRLDDESVKVRREKLSKFAKRWGAPLVTTGYLRKKDITGKRDTSFCRAGLGGLVLSCEDEQDDNDTLGRILGAAPRPELPRPQLRRVARVSPLAGLGQGRIGGRLELHQHDLGERSALPRRQPEPARSDAALGDACPEGRRGGAADPAPPRRAGGRSSVLEESSGGFLLEENPDTPARAGAEPLSTARSAGSGPAAHLCARTPLDCRAERSAPTLRGHHDRLSPCSLAGRPDDRRTPPRPRHLRPDGADHAKPLRRLGSPASSALHATVPGSHAGPSGIDGGGRVAVRSGLAGGAPVAPSLSTFLLDLDSGPNCGGPVFSPFGGAVSAGVGAAFCTGSLSGHRCASHFLGDGGDCLPPCPELGWGSLLQNSRLLHWAEPWYEQVGDWIIIGCGDIVTDALMGNPVTSEYWRRRVQHSFAFAVQKGVQRIISQGRHIILAGRDDQQELLDALFSELVEILQATPELVDHVGDSVEQLSLFWQVIFRCASPTDPDPKDRKPAIVADLIDELSWLGDESFAASASRQRFPGKRADRRRLYLWTWRTAGALLRTIDLPGFLG